MLSAARENLPSNLLAIPWPWPVLDAPIRSGSPLTISLWVRTLESLDQTILVGHRNGESAGIGSGHRIELRLDELAATGRFVARFEVENGLDSWVPPR